METVSYLGKDVTVKVDYSIGENDVDQNLYYSLNYGHVDGEEVGAYIVGVHKPISTYTGTVIAIVKGKEGVQDQLVVADKWGRYTKEQLLALIEFKEKTKSLEIMIPVDIVSEEKSAGELRVENVALGIALVLQFFITAARGERPYSILVLISFPWVAGSIYRLKEKKSGTNIAQLVCSVCFFIVWVTYYIDSLF